MSQTNSLGEFTSRLHNSQTKWNDFCGQQEIDHFLFISLCKHNKIIRSNEHSNKLLKYLYKMKYNILES